MTEEAPLWLRAGAAIGTGVLASALASIPAATRTEGSFLHAWVVLSGIYVLPAIGLVELFRAAREGLRALVGEKKRPAEGEAEGAARVLGAIAWLASSVYAMLRVGALLREKTHHHALAGVTFAIAMVAIMIALAIFYARVTSWCSAERARLALLALPIVIFGALTARAIPPLELESRALLIDGALALAAVALGAVTARHRALALLGPPLALACLAVAVAAPLPTLSRAPIHAGITHPAR